MNEQLQTAYAGQAGSGVIVEQRNRVLRNTYWLLALSLVPTVLGAWIGVKTGIVASMGMGLSMIVFLVGAFGLMFAIEKFKHSSTGVALLLGFTFFMGLMLSRMLAAILGFSNGSSLIMLAFGGTAAVFFAMASLASVIKRDLSNMGDPAAGGGRDQHLRAIQRPDDHVVGDRHRPVLSLHAVRHQARDRRW